MSEIRMGLRQWTELHPTAPMKGLRLTSPTGDEFTMAHGWRVGREEPMRVGVMLHAGDATTGEVKTIFVSWDEFLDEWKVRR